MDRGHLSEASEMLAHRGPDDSGIFFEGPVGLVHRRLSIIDLDGGAQPMTNEDDSLVVVFNGEIYNFIDLRRQLLSKGHVFDTDCDTEVILHSYEEWGTDCVDRFEGMFAFALYSRKDQSLFLSRDRCGEKPIFYSFDGRKFCFASELQALLHILGRSPSPDPESIYLYLRFGFIPSPRSFYSGITKLPAGCSMVVKEEGIREWAYYEPPLTEAPKKALEADLCEELDEALTRAVKKMLISDVPLGAFLSGGLDSSLIVALMAKEGGTPKTFCISFDDASFDESRYAESVAKHIGTDHSHYRVSYGDFDSCLSIMEDFGEPFADSSGIPTFYLSRETRREVKVALSGDGGDEMFGGYRRYLAQRLSNRYLALPKIFRERLIKPSLALFSDRDGYYADSVVKSARIFVERAESCRSGSQGLMLNTVFSHEEVVELFPELPDGRGLIMETIGKPLLGGIEALMTADKRLYLPDDILVKVDRMSMRNSLEVRAPFLDPEILKLSGKIPVEMKIRGRNLKYLMKKVALKYLPREIVYRRKHGFMVPMSDWIKRVGEKSVRRRMPEWGDGGFRNRLLDDHFKGRYDNSHKIFTLIMLGRHWHQVSF
jgi:asparagine synthase (glutamine-hydrolysing)